jgi:hypothetical protein
MGGSIIDTSWILGRARAFLGTNVTGPVDFTDRDILRCLDQETLPTLSIYLPWMLDVVVDTVADRVTPNVEGVYQVRTGERIIAVNKLRDGIGAFGAFPYDPLMFGDMVDRQLVADRQSASDLSMTFEFRPPNVVEIYPKGISFQTVTLEMKMVHPTHLRTVPPGAREVLRELFLCDLAADVLHVRQYFQQLQTVFGEVNLNLERLTQQADKRSEVVESLARLQHKSGQTTRLWIA